jgi:hypothetical protein
LAVDVLPDWYSDGAFFPTGLGIDFLSLLMIDVFKAFSLNITTMKIGNA